MAEKRFNGFDDTNIEKQQEKIIQNAKEKKYSIVSNIPFFLKNSKKIIKKNKSNTETKK